MLTFPYPYIPLSSYFLFLSVSSPCFLLILSLYPPYFFLFFPLQTPKDLAEKICPVPLTPIMGKCFEYDYSPEEFKSAVLRVSTY